jgi:hypothetical protein
LTEHENYETLICKAAALTNLNNTESAIKSCEDAICLDRKRYEGYLRRGINHFLNNYSMQFFILKK